MPWGDQMTTFSRVQSDVKGGPLGWVRWGFVKGPESKFPVPSARRSHQSVPRDPRENQAQGSNRACLRSVQVSNTSSKRRRIHRHHTGFAGFLIVESQKQRTFQPLLNLYTSLFNYLLILSYTCLLRACVCTCAKLHVSRSEGNFKELIPSFH